MLDTIVHWRNTFRSLAQKHPRVSLALAIALPVLASIKWYAAGTYCKAWKDMTGKVVVVTGANCGIGYETALKLAKLGASVLILCRDLQRGRAAYQKLKKHSKNGCVEFIQLDLADKKSIQTCAKAIHEKYQKIHILVNNAGIMAIPNLKLTKDGLEIQIGTNHFGHFYLTQLLFDLIKASGEGRIINVSSLASERNSSRNGQKVELNFEDINNFQRYTPFTNYSISKLCNVMFAKQLDRRCKQQRLKVKSFSLHPGVIPTQLGRYYYSGWRRLLMPIIAPLFYLITKTVYGGAQTTLHLCLEEFELLEGGGYYADCALKKNNVFAESVTNNQRLWKMSEDWTGQVFL